MSSAPIAKRVRRLLLLALITVLPGGYLSAQLDPELAQFLQLYNQYRVDNFLQIVRPDVYLNEASIWMAADMNSSGILGYVDSLNRFIFERHDDFGYIYNGLEVIGFGYPDVATFFDALKADPDDNALLLDDRFNCIGFGHSGDYWCVDLGFTLQTLFPASKLTSFTGSFSPGFNLVWTCTPGYEYRVKASGTMEADSWIQLGPTLMPGSGQFTLSYLDTSASGQARRFYRIDYDYIFVPSGSATASATTSSRKEPGPRPEKRTAGRK